MSKNANLEEFKESLFKELTVEQVVMVLLLSDQLRRFVKSTPLATVAFAIVGAELQAEMDRAQNG